MMQKVSLFDGVFSPLLTTEAGKRLGWVCLILMGLLTVITFVSTPFYWYKDVQLANGPTGISPPTIERAEGDVLSKKLPDWHLFGLGAEQQTSIMPITSLQLHLVGVIKAAQDSQSQVIISEANQPGKMYQVGDRLGSGVKIYAITNDGVILQNGERLEKLPLQRSALMFQGMPKKLLPEE